MTTESYGLVDTNETAERELVAERNLLREYKDKNPSEQVNT